MVSWNSNPLFVGKKTKQVQLKFRGKHTHNTCRPFSFLAGIVNSLASGEMDSGWLPRFLFDHGEILKQLFHFKNGKDVVGQRISIPIFRTSPFWALPKVFVQITMAPWNPENARKIPMRMRKRQAVSSPCLFIFILESASWTLGWRLDDILL